MSRLVASQITRRFAPSATAVVDNVSLTVEPGQIVALAGESGAGKSTLLRLIAGLEAPDAGSIHLGDRLLSDERKVVPPEQRGIGLVFQNHALFPHLTVEENVAFGLKRRTEKRGEVARLLALAGLSGHEKRLPHELSGGERQRIALVRTLAPQPALVLLDEPFSSLDVTLKRRVRGEVGEILRQAGVTALLVTHDVHDALDLADQIAVMRGGKILQSGKPEELYQRPATRDVAWFFGACNFLPAEVFPHFPGQRLVTANGVEEVGIRPHDLILVSEELARTSNGLTGEIVASRFHGEHWETRFHADGLDAEVLVHTDGPAKTGRGGLLARAVQPFNRTE